MLHKELFVTCRLFRSWLLRREKFVARWSPARWSTMRCESQQFGQEFFSQCHHHPPHHQEDWDLQKNRHSGSEEQYCKCLSIIDVYIYLVQTNYICWNLEFFGLPWWARPWYKPGHNGNLHTSKLLQSSLCSILHFIKIKNTGCLQKYFVSLKWKIFGTPLYLPRAFSLYLSNFAISIRYRGFCIWLMQQNEWYTFTKTLRITSKSPNIFLRN